METLLLLRKMQEREALLTFYTGFPNVQTMMALYEYLDPGVNMLARHLYLGPP